MNHRIVRADTPEKRKLIPDFINLHHSYIKYADRPSRKCYWLLYEDEILVGIFGLASAFSRSNIIKKFMQEHNVEFNELGNNIVYCLNGCQDRNAGTKFLKLLRKDAALWWKKRYGNTLKAIQCFVLPPRNGAIYKADNWIQIGISTGGTTQTVRTLYGEDRDKYPKSQVEIRTFKSGEVKYLLRSFTTTEPKLMFVKLL